MAWRWRASHSLAERISTAVAASQIHSSQSDCFVSVARPVVRVRRSGCNWAYLSSFVLLLASNLVYYTGAVCGAPDVATWGLYSGLYLVLALVLAMARALFFIDARCRRGFRGAQPRLGRCPAACCCPGLAVLDVFFDQVIAVGALSPLVFLAPYGPATGLVRAGILRAPPCGLCIWAMDFSSSASLKALAVFSGIAETFGVTRLCLRSIGTITPGMMSRVSLGHTGRNVFDSTEYARTDVFAAAGRSLGSCHRAARNGADYIAWVAMSQSSGCSVLVCFLFPISPVLIRPQGGRAAWLGP